MAGQKKQTPKKTNTNEDMVIYQILIAIVVASIAMFAVHQLNQYFGYPAYFLAIYQGVVVAAVVFGALAIAAAIAAIALRRRRRLAVSLAVVAVVLALYGGTCLIFRLLGFNAAKTLYCSWVALAVLYAIRLLYQPEFFSVSTITALAGGTFYYAAKTFYGNMTTMLILLYVLLGLLIVLVFGTAAAAAKHGGTLTILKKPRVIFAGPSPLMLYITCAVWALCMICVVLLGASFAYYCMFAAIAYELVAACYYTVKLR